MNRGHLLVPEQRAEWVMPNGATRFTTPLTPGVTETPKWPYEQWSISSFSLGLGFQCNYEPPVAGEPSELKIGVSLLVADEVVWIGETEHEVRRGHSEDAVFSSRLYANLAAPIIVLGGQRFSLTFSLDLQSAAGAPQCIVAIQPFRIPFTVEGR